MLFSSLCLFTVDAAQYAVVTEFGKPVQVVTEPGLSSPVPKRLHIRSPPVRIWAPGQRIPVARENSHRCFEHDHLASSTIIWRIADPRRFLETVFDRVGAELRLGDILFAALGAAIGQSPLTTFVTLDPAAYHADAVLAEVTQKCREAGLRDYGIAVVDVQLQNVDFPKQNRDRVYARMSSERGSISMRYRSEGEEVGLNIRAVS